MLSTVIASLLVSFAAQGPALHCPVTGEAVPASAKASVDYNGVRYTPCCAGCAGPMKKDPVKMLKSEKLKGLVVGVGLFDPVTGLRVNAKEAKGGFSDFEGVRYMFASADSKKAFDAEPKKFGIQPEKEALFCAVMGHEVKDYASAGGYVDHAGTRYYVCCAGCMGPMKKDAAALAAKAAKEVKKPAVMDSPKEKAN